MRFLATSLKLKFQDSRGGGSSYASIDGTSPRVGGSASSTPLPFNRAETPAFPVSNRETPLPFHPLLYQGADQQPQPSAGGFNSLVHRLVVTF